MPRAVLTTTYVYASCQLSAAQTLCLIEVSKPETIKSSWQKATLTRCMSAELFVEANKILGPKHQDVVQGSPLPSKVDEIMDDEEEVVMFVNAAGEEQGWWQGIALRVAGETIPPMPGPARPQRTRAHLLCPLCQSHIPAHSGLYCPDSACSPRVRLSQAPGPGTCTWDIVHCIGIWMVLLWCAPYS